MSHTLKALHKVYSLIQSAEELLFRQKKKQNNFHHIINQVGDGVIFLTTELFRSKVPQKWVNTVTGVGQMTKGAGDCLGWTGEPQN